MCLKEGEPKPQGDADDSGGAFAIDNSNGTTVTANVTTTSPTNPIQETSVKIVVASSSNGSTKSATMAEGLAETTEASPPEETDNESPSTHKSNLRSSREESPKRTDDDDLSLGASASPTVMYPPIESRSSDYEGSEPRPYTSRCSTKAGDYEGAEPLSYSEVISNGLQPLGYVGLVNQAATCYLNSLLQTLYMTPEFRNALYKWEFTGNEQEAISNIPCQLQRLFLQLQTASRRAVKTTSLTRSFGWDSSEAWQQHDIQELCRVMFDALEHCFKNTDQANFINKLYEGKMKDYVKCLECGTENAREDTFLDIPLPIRPFGSSTAYHSLEEALSAFVEPELLTGNNKYKCSNCDALCDAHKGLKFTQFPYVLTIHLKRFDFDYQTLHRIKLNDKVTFKTLLDLNCFVDDLLNKSEEKENVASTVSNQEASPIVADTTPDKLDDASTSDSGSALDAEETPSVENQSLSNLDINHSVEEDEGIDVSSVYNEKNKSISDGSYIYQLFSIMIHSGSALGGHYYAYIMDFKTGEWFCFNDQSVTKITYEDIAKTYGGNGSGGRSYYSSWTSSANAYMLMYRRIDKELNTYSITEEQFPKHIKELVTKLASDEVAEREAREIDRLMCKIKLFCQHPSNKQTLRKKKLKLHKDTTFAEATKEAFELLELADVTTLDNCRLVKYEVIRNSIECSFENKDDDPISEVLGGVKSAYEFDLMMEIKEPHRKFEVYKTGGTTVAVYVLNLSAGEVEGPHTVRASLGMTVLEFKQLLGRTLSLDPEKMRIVHEQYNPEFLQSDEDTLKTIGFYKSDQVYIEASGVEDVTCFAGTAMNSLLTRYKNTITVQCTLPDLSEDALKELQIPRYVPKIESTKKTENSPTKKKKKVKAIREKTIESKDNPPKDSLKDLNDTTPTSESKSLTPSQPPSSVPPPPPMPVATKVNGQPKITTTVVKTKVKVKGTTKKSPSKSSIDNEDGGKSAEGATKADDAVKADNIVIADKAVKTDSGTTENTVKTNNKVLGENNSTNGDVNSAKVEDSKNSESNNGVKTVKISKIEINGVKTDSSVIKVDVSATKTEDTDPSIISGKEIDKSSTKNIENVMVTSNLTQDNSPTGEITTSSDTVNKVDNKTVQESVVTKENNTNSTDSSPSSVESNSSSKEKSKIEEATSELASPSKIVKKPTEEKTIRKITNRSPSKDNGTEKVKELSKNPQLGLKQVGRPNPPNSFGQSVKFSSPKKAPISFVQAPPANFVPGPPMWNKVPRRTVKPITSTNSGDSNGTTTTTTTTTKSTIASSSSSAVASTSTSSVTNSVAASTSQETSVTESLTTTNKTTEKLEVSNSNESSTSALVSPAKYFATIEYSFIRMADQPTVVTASSTSQPLMCPSSTSALTNSITTTAAIASAPVTTTTSTLSASASSSSLGVNLSDGEDEAIDLACCSVVNSDQSASEDSSLTSDSDRTLVGDPIEDDKDAMHSLWNDLMHKDKAANEDLSDNEYIEFSERSPSKETDNPSSEGALSLDTSSKTFNDPDEEVKRYFKAEFTTDETTQSKCLKLTIDKRMTFGQLKNEMQQYLGVSEEHFKLYRFYPNNQEYECNRMTETLKSYSDYCNLGVKLVRALLPGEIRGKVYLLQPMDSSEPAKFLIDWVIAEGSKVEQVKKQIVKEVNLKCKMELTEDKVRLRKKNWKTPQMIYLDHYVFGDQILFSYTWEIYLQELDGPEEKTDDEEELALFIKWWKPSTYTTEPLKEIIIKEPTAEALKAKMSEISNIPVENIEFSKGKSTFPCDMSVLDINTNLDWTQHTGRLDQKPWYIIDHGSIMYYRDKTEELKELTKEEKTELNLSEGRRLNKLLDTYFQKSTYTSTAKKERRLKINIADRDD